MHAPVAHHAAGIIPPEVEAEVEAPRIEGAQGRRAEPPVVVDALRRPGLVGRIAQIAAHARRAPGVPRVHATDLPELARADAPHGLDEVRAAALLEPDLDDALAGLRRGHDGAPLGDVVAERLFDVDILAGLHGAQRRDRVPMIGRRDNHRVDVLAVEDLAVVHGFQDAGSGRLSGRVQVAGVDVADPEQARVGQRLEVRQVESAAPARADKPQVDAVAGAGGARRQARRRRAGGAGAHETSPGESFARHRHGPRFRELRHPRFAAGFWRNSDTPSSTAKRLTARPV